MREAARRTSKYVLAEYLVSLIDDSSSRPGQPDFTLRSIKQLDAKSFFQLADLLAQRRLADMQAYCGTAEMQFLGDGDQIA